MKVTTDNDLKKVAKIIGKQNVKACRLALADGAKVWVFTTEAEIKAEKALTVKEKREVLRILREEGLGYAGWFRRPSRSRCVPGITPCAGHADGGYHDPHGNYRSGYGSGSQQRH